MLSRGDLEWKIHQLMLDFKKEPTQDKALLLTKYTLEYTNIYKEYITIKYREIWYEND